MEWLRRAVRRLRMLVRHEAIEDALQSEISHHIECETTDLIRRGTPPDLARRQALLAFGGPEQVKEQVRDSRGTRLVEDAVADVLFAARLLRRYRGFSIATILTFALGIGMATSMLSVVYGVLLRPLPYAHPDRLVTLWERDVTHDGDRNVVSLENYSAWRERTSAFSGMAAVMPTSVTLVGGATPERVIGAEISTGYFRLLGVAPALGRDFVDTDTLAQSAIILSDALWKRRFGGDPGVIGRMITVSGRSYEIVGVMPASFDPPRFGWLGGQGLWFPMVMSPERRAWGRFLLVVARLRDRVSPDQARDDLRTVAGRLEQEIVADRGWSTTLVPLATEMTGDARSTLLVLLAAVGLLLSMAMTNVALLSVSAMRRRGHELAVRRAIGATDRRLFRQLFAQSALLASIGSVAGVLAAALATNVLVSILPPDVPRVTSIQVDGPVLFVTTLIAAGATLVFGVASARRARGAGLVSLLSGTESDLRSASRTKGDSLVVIEIALSVALSVMALLMVRSIANLRSVDLGFSPHGVIVARIALPEDSYPSSTRQEAFFDTLMTRVRGTAGVSDAGLLSLRPLGGLGPATTAFDPAHPRTESASPVVDVRTADAAGLRALGVAVISGRSLEDSAPPGSPIAVINRTLARSLWPDEDPIGRHLTLAMYGNVTVQVAGVIADVHLMDPRTPVRPALYLSIRGFPSPVRDLVVRTTASPGLVVPALRAAVSQLDGTLPLYSVTTLPDLVDTALASDRFTTLILVVFSVVSLGLASVGIFGVLASEVSRRRREIGIRMALGAERAGLIGLLLQRFLTKTVVGILAGMMLAAFLARAMSAVLFGVGPSDWLTLTSIAALVLLVTTTATLLPTVRAIRHAPLSVLREP